LGKESSQAQCVRDYWSSLLSSPGSEGWPPPSGHGNCEESVEIWLSVRTGIARWVLLLCHLWNLREGQEVASSAFTGELPQPDHPCSLKRNFPSYQPFSDLLLGGSDLKGREFKEGGSRELKGKKAWCTEVLVTPT
jgi:hypothetical protein